jgi:hypothetical protein
MLFLSEKLAEVTTEFGPIHVDHGSAVVRPVTALRGSAVVSAYAPLHTVGPGIGYVVVQAVVRVFFVSVEQYTS